MRKYTITLVLFLFSLTISSQEIFEFKFFPSVHFGFFTSNDDINNYISEDLSSYSTTFGTTDIIMSFNLGIGGTFRFFKLFEIQPLAEYSFAPKIISGADRSYSFNKFTGGMMANFLVPLSPSKNSSFILGAGLLYNSITFEEFSGTSVNPRFQTGVSLRNTKFNPQVILAYDLAKTTDEEYDAFDLDYTSVRIGVNLNF